MLFLFLFFSVACYPQVDTSFVYKTGTPFGTLDIRIAKSATNYYHLQDGTFSFRESAGVRTNTFFDMTAWDSSPYLEGHMREKTSTSDNFVMNYRLLPPVDYREDFADGYPLVIMLHGFGERGNCNVGNCYHATPTWSPVTNSPPAPTNADNLLMNNDHNLLHGGAKHLSAVNLAGGKFPDDPTLDAKAFPGFVLFPQNLNGWDQGSVQDAIRIIRLLIKKYNIDENRIYIEGLSNGGHGVYEALKRAPWLFASAIAMSAVDDGFINNNGVAHTIAHIPLWIFQGGKDVNPWPAKTMRYIQLFESAGAHIRYTLYPDLGHGTWNMAYNEPDFFSWMLGQNKATIHSFEGSNVICSDGGTRLELAKGFHAYQWEFNGQVISGADSEVFYAKNAGKYRARFSRVSNPSESQWNKWSEPLELTVAAPPVATIQQLGTVMLRDLNGGNTAVLDSKETHGHYYWYKDGNLIDLPGSADDTMKTVTLPSSHGNGAYTLVVSSFGCQSAPSSPVHVFFSDSAPENIAAPEDFAGVSVSPAENFLTWSDVSTNETGFEIWRRKQTGSSSWGPWELAGVAPANGTSFDDTGVEPTVTYQYKIRAVGSDGRSAYVPSAVNTGLVVNTIVDNELPSAPANLNARPRGVGRFEFTWSPATDNTRVREYVVYFNDDTIATASSDTTFVLEGLPVNTEFDVVVKAVDLSRNIGPASNTVQISTFFSGLYYEHTTGSWSDLSSIDWSWAEFSGRVPAFTLSPKTQEDYYNFSFDGYLLVTQPGQYTFRTTSSDGSKLWIDDDLVVDNDGIHDVVTVEGATVSLEEGPHRIYAQYFEDTQKDSLSVEYTGPDTGNEWLPISSDVLKSDPSIITAIGDPHDGPGASFTISVYPNPATQNDINLSVRTVLTTPVRVRMLDLTGSRLFEGVFLPEQLFEGMGITPAGILQSGMYLITVEQAGHIRREKVVVKR